PGGGIMPVRSLRTAFSHVSDSEAIESGDSASNATPPAQSSVLWHSTQYFSSTDQCLGDSADVLARVESAARADMTATDTAATPVRTTFSPRGADVSPKKTARRAAAEVENGELRR